jgi:hypothetical protein
VPVLGLSAGAIGLAALVAALETVVPPIADLTASSASDVAPASSEAAWTAGPLEVPSIGVVAPGFELAYAALAASSPTTATAVTLSTTTPAAPSSARSEVPAVIAAAPTPEAPTRTTAPRPSTSEPDPTPATDPTTEKPSTKPPTKPSTEAPTPSEEPTEEPTTGEPTPTEEPPTEEPPTEEPPTEEPPTEEPPTEEPPTEEPPTEEPPVEQPPVDTDVALGSPFTVTDPATGGVVATVTVDGVVVDQACTAAGSTAAENGHLVGLRLRVTPGAAAPAGYAVDATHFGFTAADGTGPATVATAAAAGCLTPAEAFPAGPLAAGQQYAGILVLDTTAPSGTATYRPAAGADGARWAF